MNCSNKINEKQSKNNKKYLVEILIKLTAEDNKMQIAIKQMLLEFIDPNDARRHQGSV